MRSRSSDTIDFSCDARKSVPFHHEHNNRVANFKVSHFVSFRFYLGTVLSNYVSSKLTSPVFSALCSVMDENEVSLKRGHQPSHDTPGKPRSKRRSSVSTVSTPVRRSISSSFSSTTTTKSPAQRVRSLHYPFLICLSSSQLIVMLCSLPVGE